MGRRRRPGNPTLKRPANSIENLAGNKENKYPVTDPNRKMITNTNELSGDHKKISQRKLWKRSLRHSWRSYKTWLTRK
jgi:hypothetical protein